MPFEFIACLVPCSVEFLLNRRPRGEMARAPRRRCGQLAGHNAPADSPRIVELAAINNFVSFAAEPQFLRNREQRRREPTGPARVLLSMIERDPWLVFDVANDQYREANA